MELNNIKNKKFQIGIFLNLIAMIINVIVLFILLTIYRLEFLDYYWDIIVLIMLLPTIINISFLMIILDEKKNYQKLIIPAVILSFLIGLILGIIGSIFMIIYKPKKLTK